MRPSDRDLRRHLVRLAVAPAASVAVICVAAALVTFHRTVTTVDRTTGLLVLVVALVLIGCVVRRAISSATAQERAVTVRSTARQAALSRFAVSGHQEVTELLHRVAYEQPPFQRRTDTDTATASLGPASGALVEEIATAHLAAEAAVLELAGRLPQLDRLPVRPVSRRGEPQPARGGSPEQFEVFANLSHRLQSLVHREIGLLDELENEIEDPDFLKSIFRVDHLATRVRRYAENLAVLGGAVPSRQWTRSVSVSDVLRSAVAEIEQYSRVKLVPPIDGSVLGHAVVDLVHLLAELAENATMFSAPQTRVLLRVQQVTAGMAIEVEDRGLGIEPAERDEINRLLDDPTGFVLGERLMDGRIGLYVVSSLARRHKISVQLQSNIYGGTQAVLVLPHEILGEEQMAEPVKRAVSALRKQPQPQPQPQPPYPSPPTHAAVPPPAPTTVPSPASTAVPPHSPAPAPVPRHSHTEVPPPATAAVPPHSPPAVPPFEQMQPPRAQAPRDSASVSVGPRPPLPTRLRRESLTPELRRPPAAGRPGPEEVGHDPGLMAAFFAGTRRAEESDGDGNGELVRDVPREPRGEADHGE